MSILGPILFALALGPMAFSASIYKKASVGKHNEYLVEGAFYGGTLQKPLSLLNLRRKYSAQSHLERVVVDIGDMQLKPLHGELGAFHVAVEKDPLRVTIDLNSVSQSALSETQIKNIFLKSPYVKTVSAVQDPEDHSFSLVLNLKSAVSMEVYELKDASRLVVDLKAKK